MNSTMKTLYHLIALIAITHLLVIGGLVGYLLGSGKLNRQSASTIAAALRGETLVPATATAPAASQPVAVEAPDRHSFESIEMQLAMLDREKRFVTDRYSSLKAAELKLIQDREALNQKQHGFTRQVKVQRQASEDAGFAKALALYTQMPPEAAKEDFMKLDIDIVVRYLMNMPKQKSAKILEEFEQPDEQNRRQEITERIRTQQLLLDQDARKRKAGL
jgi:flagellar motility protein MotE (MotC chaperone)